MLERGLKTIAFPCISTGHYNYPPVTACHIALDAVHQWLQQNKDKVERIVLCMYQSRDEVIYQEIMPKYFP